MKQRDVLKNIGLDDREADIYIALLQHGSMNQSEIATRTGHNRTSLYEPLKTLLRKDIIVRTLNGKRTEYAPKNPEMLIRRMETRLHALKQLLPVLAQTYRTVGHKPHISMHEGERGVRRVFRHAAREAHYMKSLSAPSQYLKRLPLKEARHFDRITTSRDLKPKVLCAATPENVAALSFFKGDYIDIKLLPETMYSPMEFLLYNKTTLITSWEQLFTVKIESEDITLFLCDLFDYYWERTEWFQHGTRKGSMYTE